MRFSIRHVLIAVLILLVACQKEDAAPISQVELTVEQLEIRNELDQFILATIRETQAPFDWNQTDNDILFKALSISENILAVGYSGGADAKRELLQLIYRLENADEAAISYERDELNFLGIRVDKMETLEAIRNSAYIDYVEISNYPFTIECFTAQQDTPLQKTQSPQQSERREMVLDPQVADPSYPDQVTAFDGGLRTVMRRHNMESVYTEAGFFGDNIDVAIVDNGVLPERLDFFLDNGYGERYRDGYYNPLWFFPFTSPDGSQPRPTDVFGLSILIYDTYYIHGSEMIKQVLTLAPNANIHSVRGSTWTVILFIDQILGIADAIRAQADHPDIRISSMSMGTIFYFNRIASAIEYYHGTGKMMVVSAGSTFAGISDLLGVLFPGTLPETVTATAIRNRESNGGVFELTEGVHGGPENDFTVENTNSSSVAASRTAGMFSLVWSANPSLSREEVLEILISASYFYQENGEKDPLFGWGPVDIGLAVDLAMGGRAY